MTTGRGPMAGRPWAPRWLRYVGELAQGRAPVVITFVCPLSISNAQDQLARSRQPTRRRPPAGSHKLPFSS
jgi:hypothetical protein